jgi:tetratricopeptide (TPR) repeat protein
MAKAKSRQTELWQIGTVVAFVPFVLMGSISRAELAQRADRMPTNVKLSGTERSPQLLSQRERRTALVIGNGNYGAEGILKNPPNDATDVAQALRGLGFEVRLLQDSDKRQMAEAIEQFNRELYQGGVGLFYYAGHGVQDDGGENYLIPIGAQINRQSDVAFEAIPLGKILGAMEEAGNPVNIVLLDACRNNPYSRTWRSATRGLAPIQSAKGTLISFATAPGKVAADGDGQNSPYTASLLQYIQTPDLPIPLLFQQVRQSVIEKTKGRQVPWEQSSLIGNFEFKARNESASLPRPNSPNVINRPPIPTVNPSFGSGDSRPSLSQPNLRIPASSPSNSPTAVTAQEREVAKLGQDVVDSDKRGDYTGAVNILTQIIQISPTDPEKYTTRGYFYSKLGKHQQAIQDFNQAISIKPNDGDAFRNRGLAYFSIKEEQNAARDFNLAIEINPQDVAALFTRSLFYLKIKDNRNALKDLDKAIAIKADEDELFLNRSFVHYRLGNQDSALQDITRAIELNPKNSEALYNRGRLYGEMKDDRKALKDFNQAISINADNGDFFFLRGLTHARLNDKKSAIQDFTRAIAINPKDAYPLYQRGLLYFNKKDDRKALNDFNQAIAINSDNFDFFHFRGLTHSNLKDEKSAIRDFTRAIAINPKDAGSFYQRGTLYYDMKEDHNALKDFNQAISINSDNAYFFFFRGSTHARLKDEKSAIQDFTRGIAINPKEASAFFDRGLVYYNMGDDRNALNDFTKSLEINQNSARAFYYRGLSKMALNDRVGAVADFKNAMQIAQRSNDSPGIQAAQKKLEELQRGEELDVPLPNLDVPLTK